jgi:hypothetical protein
MKGFVVALFLVVFTTSLAAQQWRWPEKAQNLKVLPPTTSAKELQRTMVSFTNGLGVRCSYCHVGEEGKDLSEYDFPSDSKPEKDKARTMISMVNAVNTQYLVGFHRDNTSSLQVTCITCHHGNALPILLEDKLKRTFDVTSIDSTIRQYRALREQFYGGFTFNFKEGTLLRLADKILEDTTRTPTTVQVSKLNVIKEGTSFRVSEKVWEDTAKTSAAIRLLKLNIELYPAFAFSYVHLANIYEDHGNIQGAIENYQQAVKLNPRDERLKKQLERLQGKK